MPTVMDASVESVQQQLERVLSSPAFEQASRIKRFLSFVVGETLAGRHSRLKGYTVGVEVFDRSESFDPSTDSIVRVEAGRLRRLLDHYYLRHGQNDPVRIDLPKGRYVPTFKKRSTEDAAAARLPSREADAVALPTGPSLAVLPFSNMSGDPAQEFFCDGITEEIIAQLARFSGLFVLARNTTFQYKDKAVNVRELCEELDAHFVLEGSVRRAGDTVRVTAQLLDATNGAHVWAESFDRELTSANIIAVQDQIAEQVSARVASPYGAIPNSMRREGRRRPPERLDAYEAVLRYYAYLGSPSQELHAEMHELLKNVTQQEPGYADAWAARGFLHLDDIRMRYEPSDPAESMRLALQFTERTLSIDPDCVLGWYAHAIIQYHLGSAEKFEMSLGRALALTPHDPSMLADLGLYRIMGDLPGPGLALVEKAMALNPSFPGWYWIGHIFDAFRRKEYAEALDFAERINIPGWDASYALVAAACGKLGLTDRAARAIEDTLRVNPGYGATVRSLLEFSRLEKTLLDGLIDGLQLAGLDVTG